MSERDKFLTEAIGECLHENGEIEIEDMTVCPNCFCDPHWNDFSTWAGFGKLWEFSNQQEWWGEFKDSTVCYALSWEALKMFIVDPELIDPDYLATTVYEFLKERNP